MAGTPRISGVSGKRLLDVPARLHELRTMEDGWFEGEGKAPVSAGLEWLATTFDRQYPSHARLPHTYPTFEGGICMEWNCGADNIILDINLSTHKAEWLSFHHDKDAHHERQLNLDDDADWTWMVGEVANKVAGDD